MPKPLTRTAFIGDWNESPDSTGRYSPRWIARKAGLRVVTPPRGPKGRIDFVLTNAVSTNPERVSGGGSDHGLILFTLSNPATGETLNGAQWNVEHNRSPEEIRLLVRFLEHRLAQHDVDFICMQEAQQYHDAMSAIEGYSLVATAKPRGADHNVILVRNGVDVLDPEFRQMSRRGWFTRGRREHAPTFTTLVTLNGWLRVGGVHETVGVGWKARKMIGPALRIAARRVSARRLVRIASPIVAAPPTPPGPVAFAAPAPPYLGPPARSSDGRNKPIRRLVIHATVSPCVPGGARSIAGYFRSLAAKGSAHYVIDPDEDVQVGYDDLICWHAPPNPRSLGLELCFNPTRFPIGQWLLPRQRRMIRRAARLTAELALAYEIPLHRLTVDEVRDDDKGICGHVDVSQAFGQSTHWDPGSFPWRRFMRLVRNHAKMMKETS